MDEKGDGGRGIIENEIKVCQSTLSKHRHGGLRSGIYEVGERRIGKWSLKGK